METDTCAEQWKACLFHRTLTVRERTDIVHSHIRETTQETVQASGSDLQRA